ncbi:MAG: hypothetical protein LBD08_01635 [Treponema sp.]|jgi:hypothetical protein|nr:hypothetical protein [Treponema sp.]
MKRFTVLAAALMLLCASHGVFAYDEDDIPYLTDEDMAAIEITLPDDVPPGARRTAIRPQENLEPGRGILDNEMARLNVSLPLYHLLILDRTYCTMDSDISGIESGNVLYKLRHGRNGYLIALYQVPREGPVFPILPGNALVVLDIMTNRTNTIREYINSNAFKRFVTSRRILAQLQAVLR